MNTSSELVVSFVAITMLVAMLDALIVGRAYREAYGVRRGKRAFATAVAVLATWMVLHGLIAESGLLYDEVSIPPRMMPYLLLSLATAAYVAFSKAGKVVATHASMFALVGLHAFRLPLEIWLHAMYEHGEVPVQMTWSGLNFDVITGISAVLLAGLVWFDRAPRWLIWAWNTMGMGFLVAVMIIANLSAPTALRAFTEGPPLMVLFSAPQNWIATVLVATALAGHLLVYRKLALEAR